MRYALALQPSPDKGQSGYASMCAVAALPIMTEATSFLALNFLDDIARVRVTEGDL
jgi:hypothetical protein